jgi:hypothetical protein
MGTTINDRTVAAEARGVEEGHQARLGHDAKGTFVRVTSDLLGHTGKSWIVRTASTGAGHPVVFTCEPEGEWRDGHKVFTSTNGETPCKHMSRAARRLEREGYAQLIPPGFHGDIVTTASRWVATAKAFPTAPSTPARDAALKAAAEGPDGDPFGGF